MTANFDTHEWGFNSFESLACGVPGHAFRLRCMEINGNTLFQMNSCFPLAQHTLGVVT